MTNEQLATFIHQGGNDELRPLLWDKVKALVYYKAEQYYRGHASLCAAHGVELCDIKQVGYTAFIEALEAYKPESEYKFTTFIAFPFRNAVAALLGMRNHRQPDPLNNAVSLDAPVKDNEDGSDTTLIELQADAQSTDFLDELEAAAVSDIVRERLELLEPRERFVITEYYLENKTMLQIADLLDISHQRMRQIRVNAERHLRADKELRKLYLENYQQRCKPSWKYFDWQPELCVLRRIN